MERLEMKAFCPTVSKAVRRRALGPPWVGRSLRLHSSPQLPPRAPGACGRLALGVELAFPAEARPQLLAPNGFPAVTPEPAPRARLLLQGATTAHLQSPVLHPTAGAWLMSLGKTDCQDRGRFRAPRRPAQRWRPFLETQANLSSGRCGPFL